MNILKKLNPFREKKKGLKYLIFAHARTGSTTLNKILNMHPDIQILHEPFLKGYFVNEEKNFNKVPDDKKISINDIDNLELSLKQIDKQYNGIKHIFRHLDKKYNEYLLCKPNLKILFLSRNNLLQTVLSVLISESMSEWHIKAPEWREKIKKHKFPPFEIKIIEKRMTIIKNELNYYKELLRKNNKTFYHLSYEDIYNSNILIDDKIRIINDIFDFFGVDNITDPSILDMIKESFDLSNYKLNSVETYKLIPNIMEIENILGCDETGWLFK